MFISGEKKINKKIKKKYYIYIFFILFKKKKEHRQVSKNKKKKMAKMKMCSKCKTVDSLDQFHSANGCKLYKMCASCRVSEQKRSKKLKSADQRAKISQKSLVRYYAKRKKILAERKYQYAEEKAWEEMFGEKPEFVKNQVKSHLFKDSPLYLLLG
jgi:hypothetical protein